MGIVSPLLPDLMREFSLSAWQAGMVVTSFGLARLVMDLPLGLLLDRINRTAVLLCGTLLIAVGSTASALSQDLGFLLVARFLMGAGSALCTVTALFSLSRSAGEGSRGKTIGTYQAAMIGGNAFSPAIGGLIGAAWGWRASFLFCTLTGLAAMLIVLVASRRGALTFSSQQTKKRPPVGGDGAKRRVQWDLVAIDFTSFVLFFSFVGFRNTMVPVFGGAELGIGAAVLGFLLGASAVIRFGITLLSGYASDLYGRKAVLVPGILLLVTATVGFTMVNDLTGFVICLTILSLGGFGNSIPTTMVVDAVGHGRVGLAISVNRFVGDAGLLVGPVVLGWIVDSAGFPVAAAATAALLLTTLPGILVLARDKKRRN